MPLGDYRKQVELCVKCGYCWDAPVQMPLCPSAERFGFESYRASGRMDIIRGLLTGDLEWTDRLLHRTYTCQLCGACEENCYTLTGKRPLDMFLELRRTLVDKGIGPMPRQKEAAQSIEKNHNPYYKIHEERLKWLTKKAPSKAKTIYFVGCEPAYTRQETANATVKVLGVAGVEFGIMPDEWCCGYPLLHTGEVEPARKLARHNIEALKKTGAERVVFSCPGCYIVFKKEYPEILNENLEFEVLHTAEYFADLIKDGVLKPKKEVRETVAYHDPCMLGRWGKVYDSPRKVLKSIAGLKPVEMERNREFSWCCGAGGGVALTFPDFAKWTALQRLNEAEAIGASVLASACPGCKTNIMESAKEQEKKIKVYDINELLAMAL